MITPHSAITGRRGYWLLDIDLGGRVLRFSTLPVTVSSSSGQLIEYNEGLSDLSLSAVSVDGQEISAAVEISSGIDWSSLVSGGVTLSRRAATLRRWYEGQTHESARVIISGLTFDPVYGAVDEALSVTISQRRLETTRILPAASKSVSSDTWPITAGFDRNAELDGAVYPLIIGYPGITNTVAAPLPAVPALLAELQPHTHAGKVIVADGAIAGSEVQLHSLLESVSATRTVQETDDKLGQKVSYVDFSGLGWSTDRAAQQYYTSVSSSGTSDSGGVNNLDYSGPLRGAGEILLWALRNYSEIKLDLGRMEAQQLYLNAVKIDTFINRRCNVWEWLSRSVLPLLPVSEVESSDGLYFQFWRWDATAEDSVASLSVERHELSRLSRVETLQQDILNEIEIQYQPVCNSQGEYHASKVITGSVSEGDSRVLVDYSCKLSQQPGNYGVRSSTIEAPVLWDDASATRVLRWYAAQHALPKRVIRYAGPPELEALDVGQVVTLSDSAVNVSDAVCLIRDLNITPNGCEVLLILLDNPIISRKAFT